MKCALCLRPGKLVVSYLLPAALYRALSGSNGEPVTVSEATALQTSKQVCRHLLCLECEQRFNFFGENYVLKNYFNGSTFCFRDQILSHAPRLSSPDCKVFDVRSVQLNAEMIVYFASSIFWRASVTPWKVTRDTLFSNLGNEYEEKLRLFLLGLSPFPKECSLYVLVTDDPAPKQISIFPKREKHPWGFMHRFYIPGMTFALNVGKALPRSNRQFCLKRTSSIFFVDSKHDVGTLTGREWIQTIQPKGRLAKAIKGAETIA